MASFFQERERRVIPNFRSFSKTSALGELSDPSRDLKPKVWEDKDFFFLKNEWLSNTDVGHAADLMSVGLIINPRDPEVINAARFILQQESTASLSQINLAHFIINGKPYSNDIHFGTLSTFIEDNNLPQIRRKINSIKSSLGNFPQNTLGYVELARLYSILGQEKQAKYAMLKALYLGKNNRYVLRSAARLFAHFGEFDIPHTFLMKSDIIRFDPWVLSAEISLSAIHGNISTLIKRGIALIESDRYNPFSVTELAAGIGTIVYYNGPKKKSKKLFERALIKPNDNSLAQVRWISNKEHILNLYPFEFTEVPNKFEAMALDNYYTGNWELTTRNCEEWFLDMPFIKTPITLGSFVSSLLDDQRTAIDFCKAGMISHPNDPQIMNNLAYHLSLDNRIGEAEATLEKVNLNEIQNEIDRTCLIATMGLIQFRKGNSDLGRELYNKAIENAIGIKNNNLKWLAIMNLVREEMNTNIDFRNQARRYLSDIPDETGNPAINFFKRKMIETFDLK